jgi:DNA-binding NtrC family response regulator
MSEAYILIVDDEPDICTLVKEILEDESYEVSAAENAEEARQARRARRPDLILLDIWMPDTDGISLLKEWAGNSDLDTPVIMMSGHGTVETAVEATRMGAYDFLEKPLSTAKLLLTVKNALEIAQLKQENIGLRRESGAVTDPIRAADRRIRQWKGSARPLPAPIELPAGRPLREGAHRGAHQRQLRGGAVRRGGW